MPDSAPVDWEAALKAVQEEYRRLLNADPNPPHHSFLAAEAMEKIEKAFNLPTSGVEGWSRNFGRSGVSYLNTGDTYGTTIVCNSTRNDARFSVGCWGDHVLPGD